MMNTTEGSCWWQQAKAFVLLPQQGRTKMYSGRSMRAHLVRIAGLHPTLGKKLDTLRAPLRVYEFVAYAPNRLEAPRPVNQQARYGAIMAFFDKCGRWPQAREFPFIARKLEAPTSPAVPMHAGSASRDTSPPLDLAATLALAVGPRDPELAGFLESIARQRRERVQSA